MSEFVDTELEKRVFTIVSNGEHLTQEDIAMRIDESLKEKLCNKPHPLRKDKFESLEKINEGTNNLYRLIHFIKNFCNKPSGETCDFYEIKNVVEGLPDEVGDLDIEINELMGNLNLNGGKKKTMKGGNPELLKNALHIIHKGVLTLKGKTGEALQEALEALDQTIVNIFRIADHVINNFDAFEALGCVRLFMSTLIGEKLSKILESILIGAGAVSATMVGIQQAPRYVGYVPTILKYLATGGVVITSSTVCFYIGDYLTNAITIGGDKYNNLSVQGQALIDDLAEKVEKSQEGKVESATEKIEEYNTTITDVINQIKDLTPADKAILKTIENTDGDEESGMAVVTREDEGDGEKEAANTEDEGDGEKEAANTEDEDAAAATTADEDGDGDEEEANEDGHGDKDQTAAQNKRKFDNGDDEDDKSNKIQKNDDEKGEFGGKKKKKGRTTQKKKKGTKGKKKASKSKKSKTKKNRKTKKAKKSNKK